MKLSSLHEHNVVNSGNGTQFCQTDNSETCSDAAAKHPGNTIIRPAKQKLPSFIKEDVDGVSELEARLTSIVNGKSDEADVDEFVNQAFMSVTNGSDQVNGLFNKYLNQYPETIGLLKMRLSNRLNSDDQDSNF